MHMACKSRYSHSQRAKKLYDISNNIKAKCEENLFDIDPGYVWHFKSRNVWTCIRHKHTMSRSAVIFSAVSAHFYYQQHHHLWAEPWQVTGCIWRMPSPLLNQQNLSRITQIMIQCFSSMWECPRQWYSISNCRNKSSLWVLHRVSNVHIHEGWWDFPEQGIILNVYPNAGRYLQQ